MGLSFRTLRRWIGNWPRQGTPDTSLTPREWEMGSVKSSLFELLVINGIEPGLAFAVPFGSHWHSEHCQIFCMVRHESVPPPVHDRSTTTGLHPRPPPRLPSSQPPSQPPVYQSRWQLLFTISLGTRDEFYTHPHDQLNAVIIFRHDGPSESCAVYMHTFEHYVRCILGQCLDLTSLPPSFRQAATLRHMANCTHFTACEGDGYCTLIIIQVLVLDFVVVSAKKGCIVRVHPPLPAPTPISPRPYTNIGGPLH